MNLAFQQRSINAAAKRLMDEAATTGYSSIPNCADLTNEQLVREYLMSFAQNEFSKLKKVVDGQIYGCAFKNIFVVFESMAHIVEISPVPMTKNGERGTHLATFWQCLG
jgi:hypothetical protein